jgi:glycosyltransferase involved in cell wall biosynthesis
LVLSWWDLYGEGGTALERSGKFYYAIAGRIESFLETVFRKHADLSIVVSSYLRKKLIDLGYPTENILLMPIGCQSNISCIKERSDARKTLGFDHSTDIFICAGSLFEQDLSLLIYSLRELKLQIKKKMPLTILIGSHSVSPAIAHELNIVVKPRIESRKEFLMHLFAADFGLLPMRCSTANKARWPSKSSDYWSVRLPVISTPINDFEDLFPIHKLGFLAQSDSPTHYAATLLFALNSSEKIRSEMESHIEQYLVSELDWNTICRKQMDTLGSLVDLDKTK